MNENILTRLYAQIKKAYYTFERYDNTSTFSLLYHEQPLSVVDLSNFVRISDHLIELDEHHYFLIFSYTSHSNTYKAVQNLVHHLDNHFKNTTSCVVIDSFDLTNSPSLVLNRLQQILTETRKSSFSRAEDESILETNF